MAGFVRRIIAAGGERALCAEDKPGWEGEPVHGNWPASPRRAVRTAHPHDASGRPGEPAMKHRKGPDKAREPGDAQTVFQGFLYLRGLLRADARHEILAGAPDSHALSDSENGLNDMLMGLMLLIAAVATVESSQGVARHLPDPHGIAPKVWVSSGLIISCAGLAIAGICGPRLPVVDGSPGDGQQPLHWLAGLRRGLDPNSEWPI